ncbi:LptF/LptG family permease [Aristophania vespae]|uniref:LptF/LptG family permease n=2 Tax=Aristophania vespae TaxID=2697033 RepID=A0A6P1NG39_9PROT|nr:LptF/LptG family permease [Aristophania vespae]
MEKAGFPYLLSKYVFLRFFLTGCTLVLALTSLISLFDFIDLLRRAASHPNVAISSILEIAGLHIPYYALYVLPFGLLLGGIICFSRLARSSELVVARAAGISVWQFLASPVLCSFLLGIFFTTAITPLSSYMYRKAERLDKILLQNNSHKIGLKQDSLWLWQKDNSLTPSGSAIIHLEKPYIEGEHLKASNITLFRLDSHAHLLLRIEAPKGDMFAALWHFENAVSFQPSHQPQNLGLVTLASTLDIERIRNHAARADTISIWALPRAIHLLSQSGFSTIQLKLHFQSLLALPFLAGTMTLISAGFSMRPSRRGGIARLLSIGILTGFALFAVSKIAEQLGKSGALPPIFAAWAPTAAGLCIATALLLFMEDG